MHALGVFHPLLLEPSLPPLKEPPSTQAVNYDAAASPSSSAVADSMGKASWEPQQPPRQIYGKRGWPQGKVPCPVDLLVPAGVKVVAVTGPNTGAVFAALLIHSPSIVSMLGVFLCCVGKPTSAVSVALLGKHVSCCWACIIARTVSSNGVVHAIVHLVLAVSHDIASHWMPHQSKASCCDCMLHASALGLGQVLIQRVCLRLRFWSALRGCVTPLFSDCIM